jgi:23S rRNA (uridine2552-2'-O)-methyltransferase
MRDDRALDLRQDCAGESFIADQHDGSEGMGARFEGAALRGGQFCGSPFVHGDTVSQSMARTKSSKAWMQRHVTDPFVQKAKAQGYRSRAAFKLEQIDAKDRLLRPGAKVVDLGAAPGGWSQLAAKKAGPKGVVVAVDLFETAPMSGVTVLRGDFRVAEVRKAVREALGNSLADVVLSDMLPNVSGIPSVDQANAAALTALAIGFCRQALNPEGVFVVKVFQGEAYAELLALMKETFRTVTTRKPEASRGESREIYLVGKGLRPAQVV